MLEILLAACLCLLVHVLGAVWRLLLAAEETEAFPLPLPGLCASVPGAMAELRRQLKRRFLEALRADDPGQVQQILDTGCLDIDIVLEVDDPSMLLASYKQGYWLPDYKLEKSWAMALHVCVMYNSLECAVLLIQEGAALNRMPNGKTPLHVACEVSNPECAALLLEHGARVNALSLSGHTPLHHCTTAQSLSCARLLILKDPNIQEEDHKTALHKAAWSCDRVLLHMLLEAGADPQALDINGCSALHYLLKVTTVRPNAEPERSFQLLLNYSSARLYPMQFHKVLQACHEHPRVVEVMANSYKHLNPTKKWRPSIPDESYQMYRSFYNSLFAVCSSPPRSLLHLSRCAVRSALAGHCQRGVELLPLPPAIKSYLLLEPEGLMY